MKVQPSERKTTRQTLTSRKRKKALNMVRKCKPLLGVNQTKRNEIRKEKNHETRK